MDLDEIQLTAEEAMSKAVEYLTMELRGIRTGRASTALVDFIKVDYYGSQTDLRQLAGVSIPEPTQILIQPFDASSIQAVAKAIQGAGMGFNPMVEGKQIRLNLPPLSGERRKQFAASIKQMGEQAKVAIRNSRRDANKHIDQAEKDKANHISEDQCEQAKSEIQDLLKNYEKQVEDHVAAKTREVQEV